MPAVKVGGPTRLRTWDLPVMSRRLYQLSYRPAWRTIAASRLAGQARNGVLHGIAALQQADLLVHGLSERGGQAHDVHVEEAAHDGGRRLVLIQTAGHEVFDLFLSDLAHGRLVGELHAVLIAVQLRDGVHAPVAEDEALAFQMALDGRGPRADEAAVDDGAARGDRTGDDLAARVRSVELDAVAAVHMGAFRGHDDRIETGHGPFAGQGDAGIHLEVPHGLEQDVVVLEDAPGFHASGGTRAHCGALAPVVDHGEGQLAALLHIIFRDAEVGGMFRVMGGGAAAKDVQLRAFFHDDDVVDALARAVPLDEHAGLHGFGELDALGHAHEIAAVAVLAREAGEFVLFGVEQPPVVLGQAVVLGERGADVHEFQAFMPRAAVHVRMVELHESAADIGVGNVDARQHKVAFVLFRQGGQIRDGGGGFAAGELEAGKIGNAHARGASTILP